MAKYQDFRNLSDYITALRVMRDFAPARFTASAGYDLRRWHSVESIPKKQAAELRKYYRQMRPLLVYGYYPRRVGGRGNVKQKKQKTDAAFHAMYGIKPLPGIVRIPLPVDPQGAPKRVRFETRTNHVGQRLPVASVEVSPGIFMERWTWADLGYTWDDVTGDDLDNVIREIWQTFKPDYMGVIAGTSRAKRDGTIRAQNDPGSIAKLISFYQRRYAPSDVKAEHDHNYQNWLDGLELYFFRPPVTEKNARLAKRSEFRDFIAEEKKRYDARSKISRRIKYLNTRLKQLKRDNELFLKTLKKITLTDRKNVIKTTQPIHDKKVADSIAERDRLTVQLQLTRGF